MLSTVNVFEGWGGDIQALIVDAGLNICSKCGSPQRSLHRDHIVPKTAGGSDDPSNIQLLCANCHQDKTYQDWQNHPEWRRRISETLSTSPKAKAAQIARGKANLGSKRTDEQRARLSAALTGRKFTPEHRAQEE